MGKVIVKVRLTNHADLVLKDFKVLKGRPRTCEAEVLVDTGATRLYLKPSVIKSLGLRKSGQISSRTTNGVRQRSVYQPARLDLMRRNGVFEVVEIDEDVPNLLGQIPLEHLDLVVDTKNQRLVPNPDHGERQMTEEY